MKRARKTQRQIVFGNFPGFCTHVRKLCMKSERDHNRKTNMFSIRKFYRFLAHLILLSRHSKYTLYPKCEHFKLKLANEYIQKITEKRAQPTSQHIVFTHLQRKLVAKKNMSMNLHV